MRCVNLRAMLLGGAALATAACASGEEWAAWRERPAHFASAGHLAFSMKNRHAPPFVVTPADAERARAEGWWGAPFEERPLANVAGRWTGTWRGTGVLGMPRASRAVAVFTQAGRWGDGRLTLDDTLASEVIPDIVRREGMRGIRVVLDVGAARVVVRHAADARLFSAEFAVDGDRLVGRLANGGGPVSIVLTRER